LNIISKKAAPKGQLSSILLGNVSEANSHSSYWCNNWVISVSSALFCFIISISSEAVTDGRVSSSEPSKTFFSNRKPSANGSCSFLLPRSHHQAIGNKATRMPPNPTKIPVEKLNFPSPIFANRLF